MRATTIIAASLIATAVPAFPQQDDSWRKPDRAGITARLEAAVAESRRARSIPAIMLAVVTDGGVFLTHAEGEAGKDRKADTSTLFPMGEISRTLADLTFARLETEGKLRLGQKVNDVLKPFVLRDMQGAAHDATLADVLHGGVRLPRYENFLPVNEASRWPTERAVRENAFVEPSRPVRIGATPYGDDRALRYAILQHAARTATQASWQALVHRCVAAPLGMRELVPDGRFGLPGTAVELYSKGFLGLRMIEKNRLADIPAANGAWIHAADLGRLLVHLLAAADGATDLAAMRKLTEGTTFAGFFAVDGDHPHLRIYASNPGVRGGIAIYPQFGRAWAGFANFRGDNYAGIPTPVRNALRHALLPAPPKRDNQWNTAVGLGGGAGGMFAKQFGTELQGEWRSKVRFRGEEHVLRMWIGPRGVTHTQFGDARRFVVTSKRLLQLTVHGRNIVPVRPSMVVRCDMVLDQLEREGRKVFAGRLDVHDEACQMSFLVSFEKVDR